MITGIKGKKGGDEIEKKEIRGSPPPKEALLSKSTTPKKKGGVGRWTSNMIQPR